MQYYTLHVYNNQINARTLIGQSAVGYRAGKPTEKSRVFCIIILAVIKDYESAFDAI